MLICFIKIIYQALIVERQVFPSPEAPPKPVFSTIRNYTSATILRLFKAVPIKELERKHSKNYLQSNSNTGG